MQWKMRNLGLKVIICLCLALAGAGVYFCSGWSHINCWTWEIDIANGQKRYTRYWFYQVTEQRIEQTWISQTVGVTRPPQWYLTVTLSPGTHYSPHYRYHGAISQISDYYLDGWKVKCLTPNAGRVIAQNILACWQIGESYFLAGDYLRDVDAVIFESIKFPVTHQFAASDFPELHSWLDKKVAEALAQKADRAYGIELNKRMQAYFKSNTPS